MALTEQQRNAIDRLMIAVRKHEQAVVATGIGSRGDMQAWDEVYAAHAALIEVIEVANGGTGAREVSEVGEVAQPREIEVGALVRHRMGGKVGEVIEVDADGEHIIARVRYTFTSGEGTCRYVTSDLVRI
jgi:hypothetical protein